MSDAVPREPEPSRAARLMKLGELGISSEREGVVHVIALSGELDLATADDVATELDRAEASDAASIVVDLSELTFMDSTGIRLLWRAHERSRADGQRLSLLRGTGAVQRTLELAGLDDQLPFAD